MSAPIRILVADDHPLFLEGVVTCLGSQPDFLVVAQATTGEQAVTEAQTHSPDMVLLDISMPGQGGIAAARAIASARPSTRIMMLTVAEDRETLLDALKSGAHGYVLKGVSAAELRAAARAVAHGEVYVTPKLANDLLVEFSRPRPDNPMASLTGRETGVLELLSQGLSNREIGDRLGLAEKTVKHHMTNILQKLHVRSRTEAAVLALSHGIRGQL